MNLHDFSLLKEDHESYTVGHPDGKSLNVPKKGLSDKAQKLISKLKRHQNYAEGTPDGTEEVQVGSLTPNPEPQQDIQSQPDVSAAPSADAEINANSQLVNQPESPQPQPAGPIPSQLGETYGNAPVQQAEKAIQQGAKAEALAGKTEADAYQEAGQKIQQVQQDFDKRLTDYQAKDNQYTQALLNNKIDPDRYWANKGTGSKIAAMLGVVLGGIGGGKGPNEVLGFIQGAIDKDISSQMNEQTKTQNLWKMNREALGDDRAATLATQNQMLNIAKVKAMTAQANAQGDIAKGRVAPVILGLEQQIQQNNRMRAMMDLANTPTGQPGSATAGLSPVDPAQLVETLVPQERRAKVYDEIQAAQDTKRMAGAIMKSFDEAVKDNTVLRTGAGLLRTPGSVYALHQSMQPTFKDLEGTVRQAAMDNTFKNITPAPGDMQSTIETKRQALADYLKSKESAPVAKGNHIDLARFESTAASHGGKYPPGSVVSVKGKGNFKVGADGNSLQPI